MCDGNALGKDPPALDSKTAARLHRLYDRIGRRIPAARGFLDWVRRPAMMLVRIPLGVLLIFGGIFSFLPILGLWMLPLGLMLLAIDFPPLQGPIAWAILKGWRWLDLRRRRRRRVAATAG
jgi:hypothetical protein